MDPREVMIIPSEAQARFEKAANLNSQLKNAIEAQNVLLAEIDESVPVALQEKMNEVDKELASVTRKLEEAQAVLLANLTKHAEPEPNINAKAGALLKFLLQKMQDTLNQISMKAVRAGSASIPIMALIDLEDQISKIIEDLHAKGMYPESEEESAARMSIVEEHTAKVLQFLKDFLAANQK